MFMLFYIIICFFLPNVIWQISNKGKKSLTHMVWAYIFMIYIALALYVAEVSSVWDVISYKHLMGKINTTPFAAGGMKLDILNIIMFMPLGFLLPFIWKSFRSFWKVALTGFGFSVMIEFLQLFNYRVTDIDDLIMNTLGACVGYILWIMFSKLVKKTRTREMTKAEPLTYIVLGVLGVCLLYNWRFVERI